MASAWDATQKKIVDVALSHGISNGDYFGSPVNQYAWGSILAELSKTHPVTSYYDPLECVWHVKTSVKHMQIAAHLFPDKQAVLAALHTFAEAHKYLSPPFVTKGSHVPVQSGGFWGSDIFGGNKQDPQYERVAKAYGFTASEIQAWYQANDAGCTFEELAAILAETPVPHTSAYTEQRAKDEEALIRRLGAAKARAVDRAQTKLAQTKPKTATEAAWKTSVSSVDISLSKKLIEDAYGALASTFAPKKYSGFSLAPYTSKAAQYDDFYDAATTWLAAAKPKTPTAAADYLAEKIGKPAAIKKAVTEHEWIPGFAIVKFG